jgi:hypothetical protein
VRRSAYAAVCLSFFALGLAGCGDDKENGAAWSGPPKPSADGTIDVSGFDDYETKVDESWEKVPALAAGEFLRLDSRTATITSIDARSGPEGNGPTVVTVTLDGLLDDSIQSERWELSFEPVDSTYRLSEARWAQRCRAGRGHAAFSAEPCV